MTIRIPDTDWQTADGVPHISASFLRKRTPQAARFTQWIQRTHAKLLDAPENVLSCCTAGLINGEIPDKNGWLSAGDALALLTYSIHSSENVPLIDAIENKSGLKLPVIPRESRLEGQFGEKLRDLAGYFFRLTPLIHLEIEKQKQIGPFRVDFLITEQRYTGRAIGETVKRQFVIEFDEAAHRLPRYQVNDKRRDLWFRKNCPDITLIRVRHEEQETWLEAVRQLKRMVKLEDCYAHCLRIASIDCSQPELRISSISAKNTYDAEKNECAFLLYHPAQPLREMETLLKRLGIPCDKQRDLYFRRAKLRGYGIS